MVGGRHPIFADIEIGIAADRLQLGAQQSEVAGGHIDGIEVPLALAQIDTAIPRQRHSTAVVARVAKGQVVRRRHLPHGSFQGHGPTGDRVVRQPRGLHPHIPGIAERQEGRHNYGIAAGDRNSAIRVRKVLIDL